MRATGRFASVAGVVVTGAVGAAAPAQALPVEPCDLPGIGALCSLGGAAVDAGTGTMEDVAASGFKAIAESMMGGFGRLLEWSMAWWMKLPSTDLTQMSALRVVRDHTLSLQVVLMTAAIIVTAGRLALAKRGALAGEVQETFLMFGRAVFASWMFAAFITVATSAGDEFSNWMLTSVTKGKAVENLSKMIDFGPLDVLGTAGLFVLGLVGFIGALLQQVLLVIRQALLIVVVAAIPVAAAAGGIGAGSQAYKRLISWSIAFVLFKPVGAIVYVVAFEAAGAPSADGQQRLLGLILLTLVALVLPALMRMVAPAISTMGSGGGGVAAAGMVGVGVGAVATAGTKGAGGSSGGDGSSASGGETGSGGGASGGGGRAMPASGGTPPPTSPEGGGIGGQSGGVPAKGAGASASVASPAALAAVAAKEGAQAAKRVGGQVGGETKAGVENNTGAMGKHEVRR